IKRKDIISLLLGLVTSTSGVEVTQHPTLANKRQGETLELSCDVHQKTYHYYWYRQLPGEINLEHLGTIPKNDLNSRLSGKRVGTKVYLYLESLQLTDSGQYLCTFLVVEALSCLISGRCHFCCLFGTF
uniref:Ig-like domain-containing protein n=1 Tax=Podarcis muralis TaxID=64176 RepID=A0A670HSY9_PODMU